MSNFDVHLRDAGLGQISEVFSAEPPHTPGGCIAQAWSIAELLRIAREDVFIEQFEPLPAETALQSA